MIWIIGEYAERIDNAGERLQWPLAVCRGFTRKSWLR